MSGDSTAEVIKRLASEIQAKAETPVATKSLETTVLEQLSEELYEAGVVNIDGSPIWNSQLRFVIDEFARRIANGGKR